MPTNADKNGPVIPVERKPEFSVDELFLNRWSPRAFSSETVPKETLQSVFEAARWAMSCFNDQPWTIGYADEEKDLEIYRSILAEGNQTWANSAPVIGIIFARRNFQHNGKPNRWADFDCGAAWMALTLQARMYGLYTHGMGGFDKSKAYQLLNIPETEYKALCAFTLGKFGDIDRLPEDIKSREKPSDRILQGKFVFAGKFV